MIRMMFGRDVAAWAPKAAHKTNKQAKAAESGMVRVMKGLRSSICHGSGCCLPRLR
jgi:hypothetical protein